MRFAPRSVLSLAVAALALPILAGIAFAAVGPQTAGADETTLEYIERMDAYYAPLQSAAPTETRGTGFKPYQRWRWFAQNRLSPETGSMVPGSRWDAWQQLTQMEQQYGTRSETWFSLGPINVAGRCLAIAVHPTDSNTAYAGFASGGLWKTTDAGATWTPLGDYLPTLAVGAIEIDPDNPNRMWMGTGEGWGNVDAVHGIGVLMSTDAGVSWELTGYNYAMSSGRDVFELVYNPATGTLMVGADNGLWRSTDGGTTFTAIYEYGNWKDVEMKKGSTDTMFACSHGGPEWGFFRSTDDGLTWENITNGTPTSGVNNCRIALTDADPNVVLWAIAAANGSTKGIYRSTDGGDSFALVSAANHYGSQGWYDLTIEIDPTNPNIVFSGGVDYYRSTNGGSSFSQWAGNVHVDHHASAWAPSNPAHFWIGSDGGVYRSTNGGGSFVSRNLGLPTLQFYAMNQSESLPTRALGGTQDNGTYLYNNNLNWSYILGGDGFHCEVNRAQPDTLYGELYYGAHYRSVNGGASMFPKNSGITEQGPWSTPTHMDFSNSATIWTAHNSKIFRTTDHMNSWNWMNNPVGLGGGRSIHQCRSVPNVVVVVGGSKVWVTTDNGSTWNDRTSGLLTYNTISDVHVHPTDPNTILLTLQTYQTSVSTVYKSTDQGLSWFGLDNGLPDEPANTIEIDPQNPNWYFLGTDLGVYVSFDAGASWAPFNTGLPHVVMADLRLHNTARLLRVATHGRGMFEVDISNLNPVAVEDIRPAVEPLTLRIYGNPASDRTTLRYGLRQAGDARIALYDLQGRQVREVLNRFEQPILGSVEVDLQDLPNGVYFARLEANGAQVTRKLVVER